MNYFIIFAVIIVFIILLVFAKGKNKNDSKYFYKNQLNRVKNAKYDKKRLFNQTEAISYKALAKITADNCFIFAQVSLGEILKNKNYRLYKDIMSKRVDFLITDNNFNPIAVVEINGTGHYLSSSSHYRDEIKRISVESAGIKYLSVQGNTNNIETNIINTCLPEFAKLKCNKKSG